MRGTIISIAVTISAIGLAASAQAQSRQSETTSQASTQTDGSSTNFTAADAASRWGLSNEEYARYETAMAGLRGRLSDEHITPIEVLGIEARTPAERRKYAERWVQMIEADTAKVLAFSTEVNDAWGRLHPNASVIDHGKINRLRAETGSRYNPIPVSAESVLLSGRLLVFTRENCAPCDADVKTIIERIASGEFKAADIYLLDAPRSEPRRMQDWARSIGVPRSLVNARKVTLNYDGGSFERLTASLNFTPGNYPAVFHKRGDDYEYVRVD